jgi:hypothetical protein
MERRQGEPHRILLVCHDVHALSTDTSADRNVTTATNPDQGPYRRRHRQTTSHRNLRAIPGTRTTRMSRTTPWATSGTSRAMVSYSSLAAATLRGVPAKAGGRTACALQAAAARFASPIALVRTCRRRLARLCGPSPTPRRGHGCHSGQRVAGEVLRPARRQGDLSRPPLNVEHARHYNHLPRARARVSRPPSEPTRHSGTAGTVAVCRTTAPKASPLTLRQPQ